MSRSLSNVARCCFIGLFNVRHLSVTIFAIFFLRRSLGQGQLSVPVVQCGVVALKRAFGGCSYFDVTVANKPINRSKLDAQVCYAIKTNVLCYLARLTLEKKKAPREIVKSAIFEAKFPANER